MLEDQVMPKRCGHLEGKQVVSVEEFTAKLRAAVRERWNPNLVILARTDARAVEGLEKAIERCKRYIETGADAILLEAPQSLEEFETVARELASSVPLVANMVSGGKTPSLTCTELEQLGYKMVVFPAACVRAASAAIMDALTYLKEKGTDRGLVEGLESLDVFRLVGLDAWLELDDRYRSREAPEAALR
jgi:methylisocitrate lyase